MRGKALTPTPFTLRLPDGRIVEVPSWVINGSPPRDASVHRCSVASNGKKVATKARSEQKRAASQKALENRRLQAAKQALLLANAQYLSVPTDTPESKTTTHKIEEAREKV